jgi:type I restriction enzyme R subunit
LVGGKRGRGEESFIDDREQEGLPLAALPRRPYIRIPDLKLDFWETSLDHYALYGIDDLERGQTYSAPQFVERFGSFSQLLKQYGGAQALRNDLEEVKKHLYVPMVV